MKKVKVKTQEEKNEEGFQLLLERLKNRGVIV